MPGKPYSAHLDGLLETIPGTPQAEAKAQAMNDKTVVRPTEVVADRSREPVPTFNALDFIANLLYQAECAKKNSHGVRWWCHGARGSRRRWRKKAREAIEQWAAEEQSTMNRQNKSPLEFFR